MAKDASFEKIEAIKPHPNADKLELATICGWQVVVGKGEFNVGDVVFYIREDAKLLGFDKHDRWPWQTKLIPYLGSSGRVKTVKLRGEFSCGIAVSLDALFGHINKAEAKDWEKDNVVLNGEFPGGLLSGKYGVTHWEAPIRNVGDMKVSGTLIPGLWKTDEENFQNIKDCEFPFGEEVLVTKKLDGTSCSISSDPEGNVHVMSRSNSLYLDVDNIYNRAAKPLIPLVQALAKHYNETIVIRGEVCGDRINASKVNLDCHGEPTFNLYATVFPYAKDMAQRIGLYGTQWHFLEVNKVCKQLTGQEIKTVPIEGIEVLTKKLLEDISNMPKEAGEGRVINTKSLRLPHFKSKSKEYIMNIG